MRLSVSPNSTVPLMNTPSSAQGAAADDPMRIWGGTTSYVPPNSTVPLMNALASAQPAAQPAADDPMRNWGGTSSYVPEFTFPQHAIYPEVDVASLEMLGLSCV